MGIKLAKPDADVFCITGEGSIQMNIQELSTCQQYKTPVKIISLNNRYGHGAAVAGLTTRAATRTATWMRCPTSSSSPRPTATSGRKIEKPVRRRAGAAKEAIRKLKDRTVFLDVRTDPTENVWPMVKAGGHHGDAAGLRGLRRETPARAADPSGARSRRGTERPGSIFPSFRGTLPVQGPPVTAVEFEERAGMKHIIAFAARERAGALSRVVAAVLGPRLQHREPDRGADGRTRRCRA